MPNINVPAAATGLPNAKKTNLGSPAALVALWHQTEAVTTRGICPDHVVSLIVRSQSELMDQIVEARCETDEDLAAKLEFAAFIVESDFSGEKIEGEMMKSIARDYRRMCRESRAHVARRAA